VARGGLSVVFLLAFWLQGKEPPKVWIWHSLLVCSVLAALTLALRERKARHQMEFRPSQPDIVPMSAAIIRNGLLDGQFIPKGLGHAAVCCLYHHEGGRPLKDVRAQLVFRASQTGEELVRVKSACWLHEREPGVMFKSGTTRHVVVAEWESRKPVSVPRFLGGEIETMPLPVTDRVDLAVSLYTKDGVVIGSFFYRILPGETSGGFNRISLEVSRD
jgi:hypothetical protein